MNLTETDYKVLRLLKRKGALDLTAIRSSLPKASVSEQRLRQLSVPPYFYPGHPEAMEDKRLLAREEVNGVTRYSLTRLGRAALRERDGNPWPKIALAFFVPLLVSILSMTAERWLIPMLPEIPRILRDLIATIAHVFSRP